MTAMRRIALRAAIAACAPHDRRWIEAMLAEARTSDPDFAGVSAIWSVAFASIASRIEAIVASPLHLLAVVAAHVMVLGIALSFTEIEFHGIDDDVCLRIAAAAGAIALGAFVAIVARPAAQRPIT